MLVAVFVITPLLIKSLPTHIAGEPINVSVHGHVVISTSFPDKCFECTCI